MDRTQPAAAWDRHHHRAACLRLAYEPVDRLPDRVAKQDFLERHTALEAERASTAAPIERGAISMSRGPCGESLTSA